MACVKICRDKSRPQDMALPLRLRCAKTCTRIQPRREALHPMPPMLLGKTNKGADEFIMVSLEAIWIVVKEVAELRSLQKGYW